MKFFIVLGLCIVAAQAMINEKQKEKLKKFKVECQEESKVTDEAIQVLKNGNFSIEDELLKKYVHCMMVKSELMTKDGKFLKDNALAKLNKTEDRAAAEKLFEICLANKGKTPYETAWIYMKCYNEKTTDPTYSFKFI